MHVFHALGIFPIAVISVWFEMVTYLRKGKEPKKERLGSLEPSVGYLFSCSNLFYFLLPANLSSTEINTIDSIQRGRNVSLLCIAVPSWN